MNSDGSINILDMISLKSYLLEKNTTKFSVKAADVDDDGTVSSKDIVELSMYLLNQMGSFSYEKNIDSDKDGLCDYIEKEVLGTDPKKSDTDGDGLSDYAEVYFCDTDPLSVDTGNTGKKDCDKDADSDKLTNIEEIKLGTSPAASDTDEDGLSDYDEVKKYKTDPLKEDTDGDMISDFGEIKLGLDPLKTKSDGSIEDNKRAFEQKLSEDSELLSSINVENSIYKFSLATKSAGYINESICINKSEYSNYLQNDAVAGEILDIDYSDNYNFDAMTISFSALDNVQNYYIFRFFEDVNMLLPVETKYDGNRAYTESEEDGTYCLIDMEKWIGSSENSSIVSNTAGVKNTAYALSTSSANNGIDVFFIMYSSKNGIDTMKQSVQKASELLIEYCNAHEIKIKLYYVSFNEILQADSDILFLDNSADNYDISKMVEQIQVAPTSLRTLSQCPVLKSINTLWNSYGSKSESKKYFFIINDGCNPAVDTLKTLYLPTDFSDPYYQRDKNEWDYAKRILSDTLYYDSGTVCMYEQQTAMDKANLLRSNYDVTFSIFIDKDNKRVSKFESSFLPGGTTANFITDDYSGDIFKEIFNDSGQEVLKYSFQTGISDTVILNDEITEDWYKAAMGELTEDEIKKLGLPDSDGDGRYDFEEINMNYIKFDENKTPVLMTFEELYYDVLARYKNGSINSKYWNEFKNTFKGHKLFDEKVSKTPILVLYSSPNYSDSDGDGIPDLNDKRRTKSDRIVVDDNLLNDSTIFDLNYTTSSNVYLEGGGVLNSNQGDKKNNVINYQRVSNTKKQSSSSFIIYPETNSDYLLTINADQNAECEIEIYSTSGILRKNKLNVKTQQQISTSGKNKIYKYSFILQENEYYYINVEVSSKEKGNILYNINIEQDNWICSEYGGITYMDENDKITYTSNLGFDTEIISSYEKIYYPQNFFTYIASTNNEGINWKSDQLWTVSFNGTFETQTGLAFMNNDIERVLGVKEGKADTYGDISELLTNIGFFLLIGGEEIPFVVGALITSGGATTTFLSDVYSDKERDSFVKSLGKACNEISNRKSDYNLSLEKVKKENYSLLYSEEYNPEWKYWNGKYINKYYRYSYNAEIIEHSYRLKYELYDKSYVPTKSLY